jgi:hypothetical protein
MAIDALISAISIASTTSAVPLEQSFTATIDTGATAGDLQRVLSIPTPSGGARRSRGVVPILRR